MSDKAPDKTPTNPQGAPAPGQEAHILQLVLKCGQFLQREMRPVCRPFGLKPQQFAVLNEIVWQGPISQKDLGERLLFEKSNISKIVKRLEEKNLVDVVVAPEDGRLTLLSETREGAALWKQCTQAFNRFCNQRMSLLSKVETTRLLRLLDKLSKAIAVQPSSSHRA